VTKVHGKNMVVTLDADDLSAFCDSSEFEDMADSHDVTTYGNDGHRKLGGLTDGSFTIGGFYEDVGQSTNPRETIQPIVGTVVAFVRQPEGTGSGLAQDSCNVLVVKYSESAPVADYIKWSCELEVDGDVSHAVQGA
jgi:hypothetical protein